MLHIIIGSKNETRAWVVAEERRTGTRIRYIGLGIGNGIGALMFQDKKNDQPLARMVIRKREDKSEQKKRKGGADHGTEAEEQAKTDDDL